MVRRTTFHFVTDGAEAALRRAKEAAGGLDVRVGGGTATIRRYLKAGLVDHIHLVVSPVLLGSGENLLAGIKLLIWATKFQNTSPARQRCMFVFTKGNAGE